MSPLPSFFTIFSVVIIGIAVALVVFHILYYKLCSKDFAMLDPAKSDYIDLAGFRSTKKAKK